MLHAADDPARNLWFARDPAAIAQAKGWAASRRSTSSRRRRRRPAACRRPARCSRRFPNNHLQYALTWYGLAAGAGRRVRGVCRPWPSRNVAAPGPLCRRAFRLLCASRPIPGRRLVINGLRAWGCGIAPPRDDCPTPRTEPVRYISTRGEAPPLGFVDVDARRPRPRRRPLCAGDLAAARPGTRSRASPAGPMPRSPVEVIAAVRRRRDRATPISPAWRARPMATFRHPAVAPLVAARRQHFRARAVPRADARLQGPGDAAPRPG